MTVDELRYLIYGFLSDDLELHPTIQGKRIVLDVSAEKRIIVLVSEGANISGG